ncbi:protein NSP-INTERACTING KINASE 3-like [Hibiscus syriacus]|uniref:Protein NSP-INTERACTING KINASE 3-like n=1 Tax=Hibiscus syriacus TaxID=106335 RepID=A0A6A2ZKX0_HIBSY|nr:protein NSP-INTERACTING KINASE 3-like [Hibiscus syriacus]
MVSCTVEKLSAFNALRLLRSGEDMVASCRVPIGEFVGGASSSLRRRRNSPRVTMSTLGFLLVNCGPLDLLLDRTAGIRTTLEPCVETLADMKTTVDIFDPLHLTWHQTDLPLMWQTKTVVALVGCRHIVVAGGACDFEDDPLSVEIYDLETRKWETCDPMPTILEHSAASMWLSVAIDTKKLYAMDTASGITCSFDPISRIWSYPFDLRHDPNIYFSVIGISGDNFIMVGLLRSSEDVRDVKIWELKGESFEFCYEIGVMPEELVEKLKG